MTSLRNIKADTLNPRDYRLPDIPEKHPDDMTSFKHLAETSNVGRIKIRLGQPETTIVSGELYICAAPGSPVRYPDLMVAFDADPELYEANNGYVVSFQGKPPDLVLEIASRHTGHVDTGVKVDFYAGLGVGEYWRFDKTGEFHKTRLAGDRLVNGQYEAIPIRELPSGELRGYSEALGLYFCWREGQLDWYDPNTEDYIPSQDTERQRADAERQRADAERQLREQERQRVDAERRRADTERQRADAERQLREQEQQRADAERQQREEERQRADMERQLREEERQRAEARIRELEARLARGESES